MSGALTVLDAELRRMQPQFERVLPAHLPSERLMRTILNAVTVNPRLLEADRRSLWRAAMTSAVLGLEPDAVMGQGYLVPFKGKVQFLPGYRGLVTLALNSGYLVEGRVVRKRDHFDYEYGLVPRLSHKPDASGAIGEDNPIVGAYATARSNVNPPTFDVMMLEAILRVRDRSESYKNNAQRSPWSTDFEAMCRKTPIRQLASHLPLTVQKAVALESTFERTGKIVNAEKRDTPDDGEPGNVIDLQSEDVPDEERTTMNDEDYQHAGRPAGWSFSTQTLVWAKDAAP